MFLLSCVAIWNRKNEGHAGLFFACKMSQQASLLVLSSELDLTPRGLCTELGCIGGEASQRLMARAKQKSLMISLLELMSQLKRVRITPWLQRLSAFIDRLQQAILQPCASYGCEVWAPADAAAIVPASGPPVSAAHLPSPCLPCQEQHPH